MPSHKHQQEESIYNLIPKPPVIPPQPQKYDSKFKNEVKNEIQRVKQDHRTMGYAKEPVQKPNEFLKAHEKEPKLPNPSSYKHDGPKKPPVPDPFKDRPLLGIKTNKNFISQNAVDTIMTVPKKPENNLVDTRNGDKFPLYPSGLAPVYIKKKDFGNTPSYIIQRKEQSEKAKQEYDAYMAEYFKKGALRTMSEGEREAILNGLKQNWDELHHKFQSLSVVTDTIPKRIKKEALENEMKLLEKDIDLLQRHQLIYIAD